MMEKGSPIHNTAPFTSFFLPGHAPHFLSPPHCHAHLRQGYVETGEKVHQIITQAPTFTVAWHPKKHLLAYACDDKDKHSRDTGGVWLFGIPNNNS